MGNKDTLAGFHVKFITMVLFFVFTVIGDG